MSGRYDKVNGVWDPTKKRYDKVNGIWNPVKKRYDRVNGIWEPSYQGYDAQLQIEGGWNILDASGKFYQHLDGAPNAGDSTFASSPVFRLHFDHTLAFSTNQVFGHIHLTAQGTTWVKAYSLYIYPEYHSSADTSSIENFMLSDVYGWDLNRDLAAAKAFSSNDLYFYLLVLTAAPGGIPLNFTISGDSGCITVDGKQLRNLELI